MCLAPNGRENELRASGGIGGFPLKKAGMLLGLGGSGILRLPRESLPSLLDPGGICPCPNSPTTADPTRIRQLSLSPIPEEAKPGSLSCTSGSHLELGKVEKTSKFRRFPQDGKVRWDHSPALSWVGTQRKNSQLSRGAPSQPELSLDHFSRVQEPVLPPDPRTNLGSRDEGPEPSSAPRPLSPGAQPTPKFELKEEKP